MLIHHYNMLKCLLYVQLTNTDRSVLRIEVLNESNDEIFLSISVVCHRTLKVYVYCVQDCRADLPRLDFGLVSSLSCERPDSKQTFSAV